MHSSLYSLHQASTVSLTQSAVVVQVETEADSTHSLWSVVAVIPVVPENQSDLEFNHCSYLLLLCYKLLFIFLDRSSHFLLYGGLGML